MKFGILSQGKHTTYQMQSLKKIQCLAQLVPVIVNVRIFLI
jgi:hypothetical protein